MTEACPQIQTYTYSYNYVHLDFDTDKGIVFLRRWSDLKQRILVER